MLVAVQGCSHGSLSTIYASISSYESKHNRKVDLLLICGDFQALRSRHDFASLAVPPKYHNLGTFHEFYSGKRKAPVLTLVIGGNHEASNYMWELYHGGWLAEGIYYMGAAGCVDVGGLRIVGASGIYKDHDYNKGHFETVPYNGSTLRSVYHTRAYDIMKLSLLPERPNTIFLSHDWPTTIPRYGKTGELLRRKPFFKDEVNTDTLGSPPLLQLMKKVKPEYWFSAHLHVKFAAVMEHDGALLGSSRGGASGLAAGAKAGTGTIPTANPDEIDIDDESDNEEHRAQASQSAAKPARNPDEINIDDSEDEHGPAAPQISKPAAAAPPSSSAPTTDVSANQAGSSSVVQQANPDEINIDSDEDEDEDEDKHADLRRNSESAAETAEQLLGVDESVDLVEKARSTDVHAAQGVIGAEAGAGAGAGSSSEAGPSKVSAPAPGTVSANGTSNLADSGPSESAGGRATKFLALDKCGRGKDFIQFLDIPSPSDTNTSQSVELRYDPEWLAISRALHPYLSTEIRQKPMPLADHLEKLVQIESERIQREGVLVPRPSPTRDEDKGQSHDTDQDQDQMGGQKQDDQQNQYEPSESGGLERCTDPLRVDRVQKFWKTAPAEGEPGGSPAAWYTNPQTVAFCGMLEVENKVNPAPVLM